MRIVKEWNIGTINCTIFKMENRYTLKLEQNRLEQVYKFDTRENITSAEDIFNSVDEKFIEGVQANFGKMHISKAQFLANHSKNNPKDDDIEFPEII